MPRIRRTSTALGVCSTDKVSEDDGLLPCAAHRSSETARVDPGLMMLAGLKQLATECQHEVRSLV